MRPAADQRRVYTVSELTGAARFLLEERLPLVWVEGELSNLRAPTSGHWYFTLKDARSQVRCAMFVSRNRFVRFKPKDGDRVQVRGRVSLYEPRGDFQLIADHLAPAGEGALRAAFDALAQKLAAEGLFAADLKRALPAFPRRIAVVSSPSGAALRDVVAVFRRRCPLLDVTLLPVAVQGGEAQSQILAAFRRLDNWPSALGRRPDVVILARGGGSLEDLAVFNREPIARAIRACPVPVVTAIGHETDVTIADFAADVRAPTPSAGAELVAPDLAHWLERLLRARRSLAAHFGHALRRARGALAQTSRRLIHPGRRLQQHAQRLDDLERRLRYVWQRTATRRASRVAIVAARLARFDPRRDVEAANVTLAAHRRALERAVARHLARCDQAIAAASRALHAVSPLATLGRGYAIVTEPAPSGTRWGTPVASIADTARGERVVAHLADGRLDCTVDDVHADTG